MGLDDYSDDESEDKKVSLDCFEIRLECKAVMANCCPLQLSRSSYTFIGYFSLLSVA